MPSPSSIITLGLGSWGSPSDILTLGYGLSPENSPNPGYFDVDGPVISYPFVQGYSTYQDVDGSLFRYPVVTSKG